MKIINQDLFRSIDYELLRKQKATLLSLADIEQKGKREESAKDLLGIVSLIDAIQDHVVDDLKLLTPEQVFGSEEFLSAED